MWRHALLSTRGGHCANCTGRTSFDRLVLSTAGSDHRPVSRGARRADGNPVYSSHAGVWVFRWFSVRNWHRGRRCVLWSRGGIWIDIHLDVSRRHTGLCANRRWTVPCLPWLERFAFEACERFEREGHCQVEQPRSVFHDIWSHPHESGHDPLVCRDLFRVRTGIGRSKPIVSGGTCHRSLRRFNVVVVDSDHGHGKTAFQADVFAPHGHQSCLRNRNSRVWGARNPECNSIGSRSLSSGGRQQHPQLELTDHGFRPIQKSWRSDVQSIRR